MIKVAGADGAEVAGAVMQDATDTKMFSFTPGATVKAGTYTVTVSGAKGVAAQNVMPSDHTFSFTVKEANRQPDEIKPSIVTSPKTIIGNDSTEMVLIPAGEFQMGSNDGDDNEKPVHTVYLDAFYIDKYEVTNAQYKKFMDATGYKAPQYWSDSNYNTPSHPVVGVNWNDAKAYADWASKSIPTEAQWEKAARGRLAGKKYVWGDEWPPPSKAGNFDDETTHGRYRIDGYSDGYIYTAPVGSFKPNSYGLYDMVGNVWEWCADWYDKDYYSNSPKSNPNGASSGKSRVLRGGSWFYGYQGNLRVANRSNPDPTNMSFDVGFRCVSGLSVTP